MKKFIITATKDVGYEAIVEAATKDEAYQLALQLDEGWMQVDGGHDWTIENVTESRCSGWVVSGQRMDGRAGRWSYVDDMRLVIHHCGHMTALYPYYATYRSLELTKRDLCRSMAAVNGWPSTEEDFAKAADQVLAVRKLANMRQIAEHWLSQASHHKGVKILGAAQ